MIPRSGLKAELLLRHGSEVASPIPSSVDGALDGPLFRNLLELRDDTVDDMLDELVGSYLVVPELLDDGINNAELLGRARSFFYARSMPTANSRRRAWGAHADGLVGPGYRSHRNACVPRFL